MTPIMETKSFKHQTALDGLAAASLILFGALAGVAIEMGAPILVGIGAIGAVGTGFARLAANPKNQNHMHGDEASKAAASRY